MWAAPGDGLNMRTLWTDTPYAIHRVTGLEEAGEITAEERDDLVHFIEHGWLVWRAAIEPGGSARLSSPKSDMPTPKQPRTSGELPPLLKRILQEYSATGMLPGYLPKTSPSNDGEQAS